MQHLRTSGHAKAGSCIGPATCTSRATLGGTQLLDPSARPWPWSQLPATPWPARAPLCESSRCPTTRWTCRPMQVAAFPGCSQFHRMWTAQRPAGPPPASFGADRRRNQCPASSSRSTAVAALQAYWSRARQAPTQDRWSVRRSARRSPLTRRQSKIECPAMQARLEVSSQLSIGWP